MIYPARGLLRWLLERSRFDGIAIPPFGVWIEPKHLDSAGLIRRELRHLEQAREMGVLKWYVTYIWFTLRYGYRDNPLEVDARAAQRS